VKIRGRDRAWRGSFVSAGVLRAVCLVLIAAGPGSAQAPKSATPSKAAAKSADPKEPLKIPDRERLSFSTKDGVALSCSYYPGGFVKRGDVVEKLDGKSVVPIILLHGWGGRGAEFDGFASALQMYGYAVIVPDLRGHGQSTTMRGAASTEELDPSKMNAREVQALLAGMIEDVETVKRFLLQKNNEQSLNIELLGIVGSELGALIAMNWATHDWSKPQLPAYKQGRDVKVAVYLSPPQSFRGYTNKAAINHVVVAGRMPTLIAAGSNDSAASRDADRLFRFLERKHPKPEETLVRLDLPTTLQGTQLLQARGLPTGNEVLKFLYGQLNERSNRFPWTDRTNPLSN